MNIDVGAIRFGYAGRAVGSVDGLTIRGGECVCLLGPNGCGKTTLLKTILGLLPPLDGQVLLDGRPLRELPSRDLARKMGYVPQTHTRYFPFTALEMVLMGRCPHLSEFSSPGPDDVAVAMRCLRTLGLSQVEGRCITELSGGQAQLVLIARALAQEPEVLVLDEPTASLDYGNQVRLMRHLRALSARGLGIVFSTHDPAHAFLCPDRAILMRDGAIVADGPPARTVTARSLRTLYGVEVALIGQEELPGLPAGVRACLPVFEDGQAPGEPSPEPEPSAPPAAVPEASHPESGPSMREPSRHVMGTLRRLSRLLFADVRIGIWVILACFLAACLWASTVESRRPELVPGTPDAPGR